MRKFLDHVLKIISQKESIEIDSESLSHLTLRHGRTTTHFDATGRTVKQNDKLVASFELIQQIRIREIVHGNEGPTVWYVEVLLTSDRSVYIGQGTDSMSSSIAAARIATITGARVNA